MTDRTSPLPDRAARFAQLLKEARQVKGISLGRDAWRRLRRSPMAMISLVILILFIVLAILTPLLPLSPPYETNSGKNLQGPQWAPLFVSNPSWSDDEPETFEKHVKDGFPELNWFNRGLLNLRYNLFGHWELNSLCGRDQLGRDVLARIFWGGRLSLAVGAIATLVSLIIGVSYGATSGFLGGKIDNFMMRFVDVLYSIPFIYVVIFLISVINMPAVKADLNESGINRMTVFFVAVGAIYWLTMARVVRGQVISLKNDQFIEAARTIGASNARIIFIHLIPNLLSIVIVYLTLTIPRVILFESFLSFLGLGVEPPAVSWGVLASDGVTGITRIRIHWWLVAFPSLALGITLFALNFLGDALRDTLDPRLKNK